ncbi:alpha/beta hydrolase [Streptomyces mobaraensis NBRC 13819 = DSM 40847]|uniref:Putative hydrolase n=1 Tax=Streptomyces mobaraensis (strain ATCC 29032 / DSM 40847 / JCM 4168 / NBRC 13819 / NCIMB 11159 / IPCR 16-22) TaxID=1223523 RepID=M3CBV3_STRM1|nr:alpha/beta hydrolase [Streptomyces mobaraensis]EMF01522.1 putative hydrolase [Streptomyces mobaraensis NBRC 13819 = DSM 40847]QTT72144.1 alpha/beta hydrolase [Streptomyces mobaraensis NBRC 13819 = DSM 40847]
MGGGGVPLAADVWGEASAPPVVLLHGGGQTRHAWHGAGPRLAALGWRVVAPDLRGHGASGWSPDGAYHLGLFADDVRALVAELGGRPVLVGASLGGLGSLLAAGEAPGADVRALVLVDVAHRPDPHGARRIVEFMRSRPDGFAGLDEAAAAVAAHLPHRPRPDGIEGMRKNLRRHGDRWVWHWDPRLLDGFEGRMDPPGMAARLLTAARGADVPILLVRGGLSDVVRADIAERFCDAVPRARRVDVAGAGHMVAGDRNEHFVDAIVPFLEEVG